jgi:glyoxylase-like metal-dependent hydrolase (beta-lactamase superfamily II)
MYQYVIHPLVIGANATDQGVMTYLRGYGKAIWIPIYSFYLEGGDQKILIDTGLEDFIVPDEVLDELGITCQYFEDALAKFDLTPDDIDIVIQTHLHNDHCENTAACKNARVFVQQAELDFMLNPHPLDHRYDPDYMDGVNLAPLTGEAEIVPGVKVFHTPGHTPGGQSVAVDTAAGRVLITGFCANDQNFPSAGPAVCPGVHTDALQAWETVQLVKARWESGEFSRIIPCHDLAPAREGRIG